MSKVLVIVEVNGGFVLLSPKEPPPLEFPNEEIHGVAQNLGGSYEYPSDHVKSVLSLTRQFFEIKENPAPKSETP